MSTTTTTVVTTDDAPQAASGGLGPDQDRIPEGELADAITNTAEITPLDLTKGVLVIVRAIGGEAGSMVKVGSWNGGSQFDAYVPAGKTGTVTGEFAAGETYWIELLDGAQATKIIERTRG